MILCWLNSLTGVRAFRPEEHALDERKRSPRPTAGKSRSVIASLGATATVLVAGLGTFAEAQTTDVATYNLKRGIERYNASDFEAAIAYFTEAIRVNSGFVKSRTKNGQSPKDHQTARIADDRITVSDPFNALAYYDRGAAWLASGNFDRAIADLNQAIRINPRHADAHLMRGRAWHSKRDLARAIADYDHAIALDPRCAFAYNNRGIARKDLQDMSGAISDFDNAIILNSKLVQAYINRGAARCAAGDLAGAIKDLNHAIASDPRSSMAYNNRGTTRQAAGDLAGATVDYNAAILLDPQNATAFLNRGLTRLQQGNVAGAKTDFERAHLLAPELKPDIERSLRAGQQPD